MKRTSKIVKFFKSIAGFFDRIFITPLTKFFISILKFFGANGNGIEKILDAIRPFGIEFSEGAISETEYKGEYGPYIQTQREDIYKAYAKKLIEEDKAYASFLSKEVISSPMNSTPSFMSFSKKITAKSGPGIFTWPG